MVALFTRAWIEIEKLHNLVLRYSVALFTRAWIEISLLMKHIFFLIRRPLHEGVD